MRDVAFSRRTGWPTTPNELGAAIERWRATGARLVDLTVSNPTTADFPYDSTLLTALGDSRGLVYAPDPLGHAAARARIAAHYAAKNVAVDPSRVVVTASTSEAYSHLFHVLADPGDRVLVPAPSYPLLGYLADLAGVRLVPYPLRYDGAWHVDLSALAREAPGAKAILTVSPNNPTGSWTKASELAAMRRIAAENGLALVADEVFADYPFRDDATRVKTLAGETEGLAFALSGLSKVAALPQVKLGWMIVAGDPTLVAKALERLEIVADTFLSVATPVQLAIGDLLDRTEVVRDAIRARTKRNLATLRERTRGTAATVLDVEGGWYAIVQLPATRSEMDWTLALLDRGVVVHPGHFFDFEREPHVVVSLLTTERDFDDGVSALVAVAAGG